MKNDYNYKVQISNI